MRQYSEAYIVWNILPATQKGLGKVVEASWACKRVQALNTEDAEAYCNMGVVIEEQGN